MIQVMLNLKLLILDYKTYYILTNYKMKYISLKNTY